MPRIRIMHNLLPGVAISPFVAQSFPTAAGFFTADTVPLESVCIILENLTDESIVGVAVTWLTADEPGKQHPYNLESDSFMHRTFRPVVPPRSRVLLGPSMVLPEHWEGGLIASQLGGSRAEEFANSAEVIVDIDAVIFEDGRLIGPDKRQLGVKINARKAAADALVKQLEAALTTGESSQEVLSRIRSTSPEPNDHFNMSMRMFATRLSRTPSFEAVLESLKNLPTPPHFFRHNDDVK